MPKRGSSDADMSADPRNLATSAILTLPGLRRYRMALNRLADALGKEQTRVVRLQARNADLERRLSHVDADRNEVRARLARLKQKRLRALRERIARERRAKPSPDVLAVLLPARHAALLASRSHAEAQETHAALLRTRESYRAAFASQDGEAIGADRTEAGGLVFWLPHDAGGVGSLSHRLHRGRLPLREILGTREVSTGGVMLDIGANVGTTSIPRIALGDVQRVFAAEPEPKNFGCLVRNIRENGLEGFIVPDPVAISDRQDVAAMDLGGHIGTHRLNSRGTGPLVRTTTLDAWVTELNVDLESLSFIKCDTQGHEPQVMRGAARVLSQRQTAWQIEFSPGHIRSAGEDLAGFYAFLGKHFEWFIDIGEHAPGSRVRRTEALQEATAYVVERDRVRFTNLLLFNGARR